MKFFAAVLLLFITTGLRAQNRSGVESLLSKTYPAEKDTAFSTHSPVPVLTLNSRKVDHLKTLGLVWGFLKYHHPAIAEGRYNWDNELFRFLPQYLAAVEDTSERNAMLYGWVKGLGNFEPGPKPPPAPKAKLLPDLGWIQTSGFSPQLRDLLVQIQYARRPKDPYYVQLNEGAQNPVFLHEIPYANAHFPDAGMQLLALYRYWNMVQYFFPYKNLIGEDWKDVLGAFIPRFAAASNDTAYTFAAQELIGRIHDSHANVWGNNKILDAYFGRYYPALKLAMMDGQLVVTEYVRDSLGKGSGLLAGDILTHINGQPTSVLWEKQQLRFPASNEAARGRDFAGKALRSNDSTVSVTYVRNGKSQTVPLRLYDAKTLYGQRSQRQSETAFRRLPGDIAYVNNERLRHDSLPKIWPQIQKARALIIDDRSYPSDFPIHDFCNYLLPKPTVFYLATKPSLAQPGLFVFDTPQPTGKKNKDYFKGKVVILVNEETQSSAGCHAMAYQTHPKAKVIGSTTAGADGNVSQIVLPGNIQTMFSGIGIYYPNGRETQRTGIAIDIVAKPTAAGIAAAKDEVLERALEWINSGK